jgi:hypothetical protein
VVVGNELESVDGAASHTSTQANGSGRESGGRDRRKEAVWDQLLLIFLEEVAMGGKR